MEEMKLEVDCYSGRTADERPVRFRLEDCQYMVEEFLDQVLTIFKPKSDRPFVHRPPGVAIHFQLHLLHCDA